MQVAMRQFKAGVSNYIALAQQGQSIEITSHKRPVAKIVGLPKSLAANKGAQTYHPAITWSSGKPATPQPLTLGEHGMALSAMVLQDRG